MNASPNTRPHIGELELRRRRAEEPLGVAGPTAEAVDAHLAGCAECRARARALDDEQRRFEQEISFDRFAAGVERAARGASRPAGVRRRWSRAPAWVYPAVAAAAGLAVVVTFGGRFGRDLGAPRHPIYTGLKGGAGMTVRIAGASGQRNARVDAAEPLAPGERLRIGYQPGGHRYLLSLSIDERGVVTPLYPEQGQSLPLPETLAPATHFLPDSVELTGGGVERIILLLSDDPIDVEAARRAARAAYDRAGGDLSRLPRLTLPAEEFGRTFAKP